MLLIEKNTRTTHDARFITRYLVIAIAIAGFLTSSTGECTTSLGLNFTRRPSCGPLPWVLVLSGVLALASLVRHLGREGITHAFLKTLALQLSAIVGALFAVGFSIDVLIPLARLESESFYGRPYIALVATVSQVACYFSTRHMLRRASGASPS